MTAGAQLDKTNPNPSGERLGGLQSASRGTTGGDAGVGQRLTDRVSGRVGSWWNSGNAHWQEMAPRQRNWAVISAALLIATIVFLLWYSTRTDWRTLYAGLDPEDSRQMSQVLTQGQIPFDLASNGTAIRVPAGQLDKARLATAAKGGPRSGRMGFELFDKPNWVGSEFDEQVNYQRALEGELEHTVATLADVQSARVHLVLPHESLFRDQERPAKAAVVLTLRHLFLADGEEEAIRNLVASAVDGLQPSQVSLVDASGHVPLGPKNGEALRLGMEQALEAKLIETLEPVTGPGNVRASVTVDYDPTSSDVTEETYDPDQTITLTMQRTEQTTGPQAVPAGVPGTATNAPNSQALPVYPQQVTPPQNAKTESGTYGASRTVRHITQGPGHIRRLTAAIVVNDRVATQAINQKTKQLTWQPRTADELRTLTALAQAAVGFDSGRGDLVTVQDLAFDENRNAVPLSPVGQALAMVERSPLLLKYGTLLLALVLVVLLGIRPALKRAKTGEEAKPKQSELAASAVHAALPTPESADDAERKRVQQVFDQVTETLKRDPAQSSRLLQSWIHSD
jgi:flagellar M-ring protein FliF